MGLQDRHGAAPASVQGELGKYGPGPVSAAGSGLFRAVAAGRELAMAARG